MVESVHNLLSVTKTCIAERKSLASQKKMLVTSISLLFGIKTLTVKDKPPAGLKRSKYNLLE